MHHTCRADLALAQAELEWLTMAVTLSRTCTRLLKFACGAILNDVLVKRNTTVGAAGEAQPVVKTHKVSTSRCIRISQLRNLIAEANLRPHCRASVALFARSFQRLRSNLGRFGGDLLL